MWLQKCLNVSDFFSFIVYIHAVFFSLAALKWCIDSDEFPHSIMKYLVKCPIFYIAWNWSLGCNFEHMVKEVNMSNKLWNCVPFTQKKSLHTVQISLNQTSEEIERDIEKAARCCTVWLAMATFYTFQFNSIIFFLQEHIAFFYHNRLLAIGPNSICHRENELNKLSKKTQNNRSIEHVPKCVYTRFYHFSPRWMSKSQSKTLLFSAQITCKIHGLLKQTWNVPL